MQAYTFTVNVQAISTTEITSDSIASDNPIHQRLLFPYYKVLDYIGGDLIEIGCGEGRGMELLLTKCKTYTAIDKNEEVISRLKQSHKNLTLIASSVPPFPRTESNHFDSLVTFQVIEHIEDDEMFMDEIHRVLKPGGTAVITTPNIKMSLTRNPWHVREYTKEELLALAGRKFQNMQLLGVYGDEQVNEYYRRNKESVRKITRFDIFNLQYRLPRTLLQTPYEILNRMNRNKLKESNDSLVMDISTESFELRAADDTCFDFFLVLKK